MLVLGAGYAKINLNDLEKMTIELYLYHRQSLPALVADKWMAAP
jgi:hypothetical protein